MTPAPEGTRSPLRWFAGRPGSLEPHGLYAGAADTVHDGDDAGVRRPSIGREDHLTVWPSREEGEITFEFVQRQAPLLYRHLPIIAHDHTDHARGRDRRRDAGFRRWERELEDKRPLERGRQDEKHQHQKQDVNQRREADDGRVASGPLESHRSSRRRG